MRATERFIEELGLISQGNGDARIAGRILGLLIVAGEELSLNDISKRLDVSRASVSTNARQLAQRGLIRLASHAGDRQDYYQLTDTPYFDLLDQMAQQFERHARTLRACVRDMREEDAAAAERAADLQHFYERSAVFLKNWVNVLNDDPNAERAST